MWQIKLELETWNLKLKSFIICTCLQTQAILKQCKKRLKSKQQNKNSFAKDESILIFTVNTLRRIGQTEEEFQHLEKQLETEDKEIRAAMLKKTNKKKNLSKTTFPH